MDAEQEARRQWFRREILPLEPDLRVYAAWLSRALDVDPEDLVHDVFARAIAAPNWREIDTPLAFAKRILQNLVIDEFRRRTVVSIEAVADLERLETTDPQPGPEATLLARDELRRLQTIIAELPEQCRRVFTLRKIYDMSPTEIAVRLRLSVSTVEKHLAKGLRLCTQRMGERDGMQPDVGKRVRRWLNDHN